ncbi:hypothetical protein [Flavobacterium psychrophilum]|uniref:Uncharacterized protein n=1 Tax=Flavobacterium psychrophilum TaxID=96345 RepID=A0A7U2R9P6_FLAPS|nr:hypothetical protein [Flavobacterium psychrophilum]OAE92120.1 hypothetical protein SU65_10210 [Flavobacterium psychrophilum]QRE04188.1 hypothetical protein H0H26_00855 [Flavobacterium psychrophilum]
MEFTKVLLAKSQQLIDNEINQLSTQKAYFQNYLDKVILLNITVQENDLIQLFENPKAYITEKLTQGENLQVGGLSLNKEKLFDLIEKPVGTNELIESIIKDTQNQSIREGNIWLANRFIIDNNEVVINPEIINQITARHSLFIKTENQQNGYNKVIQLVDLINEINEIATHKIGIGTDLGELLTTINPNDYSSYKISHQAVKRFV